MANDRFTNVKTIRILLYGEGNFSYTTVLCKELAKESFPGQRLQYEIIATDFAKHTSDEIKTIQDEITQTFTKKGVESKFSIQLLDEVDGTKNDTRIEGQFDKIICNFPTPFGHERFDMDEFFKQIKLNQRLKPEGILEIRFWADDYEGKYEYSYRLARAQKKTGFQLKKREIVDIKKLHEQGYTHILHSGEEDRINELPMVATYEYNPEVKNALLKAELSNKKTTKTGDDEQIIENAKRIRQRILTDEEYSEFSDSEKLPNDAMPARWPNRYSGSWHSDEKLNFLGEKTQRHKKRTKPVNNDKEKLQFLQEMHKLVLSKNYRKADIRLTEFLEAGEKKGFDPASDQQFYHYIVKHIDEAYENSNIQKPTTSALQKYHQYEWYAKLKVLSGVKIPELSKSFRWQ